MLRRNPMYVDPVMELLTPVVDGLLAEEASRLTKVLEDLLIRNHSLGGHLNAFIHGGEVFHILPRRHFRADEIKPLHPSMVAEADHFKMLRDNLERDRKRLYQAFSVVLPKCGNKQEVRDVLPENLVATIPSFRGMERKREEGFILNQHPVLKCQYEQAVCLALNYQANQLIY
jgi:hypothetical protein